MTFSIQIIVFKSSIPTFDNIICLAKSFWSMYSSPIKIFLNILFDKIIFKFLNLLIIALSPQGLVLTKI